MQQKKTKISVLCNMEGSNNVYYIEDMYIAKTVSGICKLNTFPKITNLIPMNSICSKQNIKMHLKRVFGIVFKSDNVF